MNDTATIDPESPMPNPDRATQDTRGEHTPTPWQADADEREGYEWNIHIFDDSGVNRICFMSDGPQTEANAAFIVEAVNNHDRLVKELAEVRDEIDRLRPVSSEWQPIETAPKDGSRCDVWAVYDNGMESRGHRFVYAQYKKHENSWFDAYGNKLDWEKIDEDDGIKRGRKTTHWMPLPLAPQATAEGE